MKLRDDVFQYQPPAPVGPMRLTAAEKASLQGIGDREYRETQDYLWSMDAVPAARIAETANGRFSVGDVIEFTNPEGYRIAGRVEELSDSGALVATGIGEKALIPVEALEYPMAAHRQSTKREQICAAMQSGGGRYLVTETRAPLPINETGRDFAITLQGASVNKPSEDEVMAYVAHTYPGARVLDADGSYPGNKLGVIIHLPDGLQRTAQGAVPIASPKFTPREKPEGAGTSQEFADDDEILPVTGEKARQRQALLGMTGNVLLKLAAANPNIDFFETSIEMTADALTSHFEIKQAGGPIFVREDGLLTPVLGANVAPAVGYITARLQGSLDGALHGPKGEIPIRADKSVFQQHDSMNSPATLSREDAPGAEHGSYITKAEVDLEKHRETQEAEMLGGPGLNVAERREGGPVEEEYYEDYYGPEYGGMLTRDVPRRVQSRRIVTAAWKEAGRRLTAAELFAMMALLGQQSKAAQARAPSQQEWRGLEQGAAGDLAGALAYARATDPGASNAVDKLVADYVARDVDVLENMGVYDKMLGEAIQYFERTTPRRIEKLRKRYAPFLEPGGPIPEPETGSWGEQYQKEQEAAARGEILPPRRPGAPRPQAAPPRQPPPAGPPPPPETGTIDLGEYGFTPGTAPGGTETPEVGTIDLGEYGFEPGAPAEPATAAPPPPEPEFDIDVEEPPPAAPPPPPAAAPPAGKTPWSEPAAGPQFGGSATEPAAPPPPPPSAAPEPPKAKPPMTYEQIVDQALKSAGATFTPAQQAQLVNLFRKRNLPADEKLLQMVTNWLKKEFGAGAPPEAPAAPEPAAPPAAAPAAPEPPPAATPPAAAGKPKRQKPGSPFTPGPEMSVFMGGKRVQAPPGGTLFRQHPSGMTTYRVPNEKARRGYDVYQAYPPGAPTPESSLSEVKVQRPPAAAPAGVKAGARRQAYKPLGPQRRADDPTPGTYHDKSMTDNYGGRIQPAKAAMRFQLKNLRRSGDYIVGDVVWDTEVTKAMSAGNVEHNIVSFVKGCSTLKDPIDLGNIGRVRVTKLDVHTGVAEVKFRSSEARALPPEFLEIGEGVTHHVPLL